MIIRLIRAWWFWLVMVALTLFLVWIAAPLPPTHITFVTGSTEGAYFAFAQEYRPVIEDSNVTFSVQPSSGSVEGLSLLQSGEVDAGFIQGGIAQGVDTTGVSALASVFYEPVWVFHRAELDANNLASLDGLRIAIGPDGSGTQPVARLLLDLVNISDESAELLTLPSSDARTQLVAGEIDAAVFIISPQAEWIVDLLRNPDISLLSFERAQAYTARYPFMSTLTLGEGLFDLVENIPENDITLLAVTAQLAVRDDLHPNLMRLLLRNAFVVHTQPRPLQDPTLFPSQVLTELPLNDEARRYFREGDSWFENNFPFMLAALLDRLIFIAVPLFSVFAVVRGVFPALGLAGRFRTSQWYRQIEEVDKLIDRLPLDAIDEQLEHVDELEQQINDGGRLPFMGFGAVYNFKLHLDYVRDRLEDRRQALLDEASD